MAQVNVYKVYAKFNITPENFIEKLYIDTIYSRKMIGELELTSNTIMDKSTTQLVMDKLNGAASEVKLENGDNLEIVDIVYDRSYDKETPNDQANEN